MQKTHKNSIEAKHFYETYLTASHRKDESRYLGAGRLLPYQHDVLHERLAKFISKVADSFDVLYPEGRRDDSIEETRRRVIKEALYFVMRELIHFKQQSSLLFDTCLDSFGKDKAKVLDELMSHPKLEALPKYIENVDRYNHSESHAPIALMPEKDHAFLFQRIEVINTANQDFVEIPGVPKPARVLHLN